MLTYWRDEEHEEYVEWIESFAEKHSRRLFGHETDPPFDALDYLDQDSFSDDEEDEAATSKDGKEKALDKDDDVISLSDSDDEGDDSSDEETEIEVVKSVEDPSPSATNITQKRPLFFLANHMHLNNLNAMNSANKSAMIPRSSRAQLMISLRKQVQVTAKENYCSQRKIKSDQLSLRIEISEKCRQLIELLKERFEEKVVTDRESRRKHFLSTVRDILRCD